MADDAPREFSVRVHVAALATSWVEDWKRTLVARSWLDDAMAGVTVAAVALPLNVALAVFSGLSATAGLVAGAVGGGLAAIFGGAPLQVTGPAAALSTLVLAIAVKFGAVGVAATCIVVGLVQLGLGLVGAGRAVRFVPETVLAGFTTGVGLKLLDGQIPEFLGFRSQGIDYKVADLARMMHEPRWLHHVSWEAATCGLIVAFMVTRLKSFKRFPAAIVGIAVTTFISVYVSWDMDRVGEVQAQLPTPTFPLLADEAWLDLVLMAVPVGILAGAESLLSARAVDHLAGAKRPHDPNLELVGQGVANFCVGLMSGLPVSGVVVRSAVNVSSGGKTRLASLTHAVLLVLSVVYLGSVIAVVPKAALAGLLIVVGLRLVEYREFVHLVRKDRFEASAFAITAAGTVSGHLMTGLVAGLAIHHGARYFKRHDEAREREVQGNKARGVRAVLDRSRAEARRPEVARPGPDSAKWLQLIQGRGLRARTAFVHPQATVIGRVTLGANVHVAAGSSVRADEGSPFFIGDDTNLQDGVTLHALKDRRVVVAGEDWAIYVGKNVSIAHNALVHGPCYVGDDTFIGFKAIVHDSVIGKGCFVGHGAIVVGVEIPDGRRIPNGRLVDTADAVDALPRVDPSHEEFNEDVVEVNRGLASAYRKALREEQDPPAGDVLDDGSPAGHFLAGDTLPRRHLGRF
ncbi:MAG: SulP family inorganic anion transporter [Polyangiaceae bacterium]